MMTMKKPKDKKLMKNKYINSVNIKAAFTLAEILLTITIIGIAAALVLPAIMAGQTKNIYETNYRKAVKYVNDAISINIAKGGKSAYYTTANEPLQAYLQKNMTTMASTSSLSRAKNNSGFYSKDNMRFEFPEKSGGSSEFSGIVTTDGTKIDTEKAGYECGIKGMNISGSAKANEATPCIMLVDTNGDTPPNTLTTNDKVNDMFLIIVTDKAAFPYGAMAQKVYYDD